MPVIMQVEGEVNNVGIEGHGYLPKERGFPG